MNTVYTAWMLDLSRVTQTSLKFEFLGLGKMMVTCIVRSLHNRTSIGEGNMVFFFMREETLCTSHYGLKKLGLHLTRMVAIET